MSSDNSLANKHRPRLFGDIIGQDSAVSTMRGMITRGEFRSSSLLSGPPGVGKTTLARLLALYFNCSNLQMGEPCGTCGSCISLRPLMDGQADSPDVIELNAALHGGIDLIRKLESIVTLSPRFRYRVFIMDEAQQITAAAFGGALKILEDSPQKTKFIFCTTNPEKILPAIMDRCLRLKLFDIDRMLVAKYLYKIAKLENFNLPDDRLKAVCLAISTSTGGSVREAITLLDSVISYVVGSGGADKIDDVVQQKMLSEVVHSTPSVMVQRYISALFSNSKTQTFLVIKGVDNPEYFVRSILETFHQILYRWIDTKYLADDNKNWLLRDISFPDQLAGRNALSNTQIIETVLDDYCKALERIKSYMSDPLSILQATTLRVMRLLQGVQGPV